MSIMYNRSIHTFIHSSMVKRSSSKRAYKKRRTVRKSRVIRRRKTARSKTLRGGMPNFADLRGNVIGLAGKVGDRVGS